MNAYKVQIKHFQLLHRADLHIFIVYPAVTLQMHNSLWLQTLLKWRKWVAENFVMDVDTVQEIEHDGKLKIGDRKSPNFETQKFPCMFFSPLKSLSYPFLLVHFFVPHALPIFSQIISIIFAIIYICICLFWIQTNPTQANSFKINRANSSIDL